jgi:hypothetical protein
MLKSSQVRCALASVLLGLAGVGGVTAQSSPTLYASGQFPVGHVYTEGDLESLVGQTFSTPAYLAGRFLYVGFVHGQHVFSTFTPGLANSDHVVFGKTLIVVKFWGNAPPNLTAGTAIVPTAEEPLTLLRVSRSADGSYLLVQAESLSEPSGAVSNR